MGYQILMLEHPKGLEIVERIQDQDHISKIIHKFKIQYLVKTSQLEEKQEHLLHNPQLKDPTLLDLEPIDYQQISVIIVI